MMSLLVISIILGSVVYILWPLRHVDQVVTILPDGKNGRLEDLFDQRENLLAILKDLESDHLMDKISSTDFEALETSYRTQAIQVLEKIDQIDGEFNIGAENNRGSSTNSDNLGATAKKHCTSCGIVAETDDRFCVYCGNNLS